MFCFSYNAAITNLKTCTQIHRQVTEFKSFPYFSLWATILISPYFQPQASPWSTTVPSRPGKQQSHCIIRQTLVRDDTSEQCATHSQTIPTSNQQQHRCSMGKPGPYHTVTSLPADVSCSLSLCTGLYDIQHLTLIGCQLLSKSVWRPSLITDEREKQRDEECHPLKDKKISHQDCNDGVGQGGGSSERRQMSLIKINHRFWVNTPTKKLFPKLIMLSGVTLESSYSF